MFDYYYGKESEQFTFFRIPKVLFKEEKFKKLSSDSKILYGLMLDRMSLSRSNNWIDDENKVYIIYPVEEIEDNLGCGNQKVSKLLSELKEIGLLEVKRQGLGKPSILYVKNFIASDNDKDKIKNAYDELNTDTSNENSSDLTTNNDNCNTASDGQNSEFPKSHLLKCENHISRNVKITSLEVCKSHANNTNINNTKYNNTSFPSLQNSGVINDTSKTHEDDGKERKILINAKKVPNNKLNTDAEYEKHENLCQKLKKQIDYELLVADGYNDQGLVDTIVEVMERALNETAREIIIQDRPLPLRFIHENINKLNMFDIQFVCENIKKASKSNTNFVNYYKYILTALYNAPMQQSMRYTALN